MENLDARQINIDSFTFYFNSESQERFIKASFGKFKNSSIDVRKKVNTILVDAKESVLYAGIFSYLPNLETIVLPDTMVNKITVEPNAFEKNKKLKKIVVNDFLNLITQEKSFAGTNSNLMIVAGDITEKRAVKPKMLTAKLFLQLYRNSKNEDAEQTKDNNVTNFKCLQESKSVTEQRSRCYKLLHKKFNDIGNADTMISRRYWNKIEEKSSQKFIVKLLRSSFVWAFAIIALAIALLTLLEFDFQKNLIYVVCGAFAVLFLCIGLKAIIRKKQTNNRYTKKVESFEKKFYKNMKKLDVYYND